MALINWTNEFSIGIPHIDSQHQKLVEMVNNLHAAMLKGQAKDALGKLLDELKNYTVYHFASEEKVQQECNYPGYQAHKILHDKLTEQVVEFQNKFKSGNATISSDLLGFLKDWLINHIQREDKKIGQFASKTAKITV